MKVGLGMILPQCSQPSPSRFATGSPSRNRGTKPRGSAVPMRVAAYAVGKDDDGEDGGEAVAAPAQ